MRVSILSGVVIAGGILPAAWACAGCVALPMNIVTATAPANAALMNLHLVVLIIFFIVDCRPNNTVGVSVIPVVESPPCRLGILSSMGLWGNIPGASVPIYHPRR